MPLKTNNAMMTNGQIAEATVEQLAAECDEAERLIAIFNESIAANAPCKSVYEALVEKFSKYLNDVAAEHNALLAASDLNA